MRTRRLQPRRDHGYALDEPAANNILELVAGAYLGQFSAGAVPQEGLDFILLAVDLPTEFRIGETAAVDLFLRRIQSGLAGFMTELGTEVLLQLRRRVMVQ